MPDNRPFDGCPAVVLVIRANACAVRQGLGTLCETSTLRSLPEAARHNAELVLAEVLNNIVEHAYGRANPTGRIELTVRAIAGGLVFRIVDCGRAMPQALWPAGHLPRPDPHDPPEGGWGWHLIRSLSHDLRYSRIGGQNQLTFRLVTDDPAIARAD